MIEQLTLVRHGETVHNVAGVAQGWNDSALSPRGERQVARLAERLVSTGADAIFSSTLERALTTARAIAEVTGLPITPLDDLREMNYGTWEGQAFLDVRQGDTENYHRWLEDPDHACPGGESHNDVLRRMRAAIAVATSAKNGGPPPRRPVIVTHGTAIRIAATALLGIPVSTARQFAQDNASINVFLWRTDRFVLKLWNDTTHCTEE